MHVFKRERDAMARESSDYSAKLYGVIQAHERLLTKALYLDACSTAVRRGGLPDAAEIRLARMRATAAEFEANAIMAGRLTRPTPADAHESPPDTEDTTKLRRQCDLFNAAQAAWAMQRRIDMSQVKRVKA